MSSENDKATERDWLAEAKALCDAATRGPWRHPEDDGTIGSVECSRGTVAQVQQCAPGMTRREANEQRQRDAEFIASARTDLPRALAVVEAADALAAAVDALAEAERYHVGDWDKYYDSMYAALAAYRKARGGGR